MADILKKIQEVQLKEQLTKEEVLAKYVYLAELYEEVQKENRTVTESKQLLLD